MLILLAVSRTRMHFHICSVREIERRKWQKASKRTQMTILNCKKIKKSIGCNYLDVRAKIGREECQQTLCAFYHASSIINHHPLHPRSVCSNPPTKGERLLALKVLLQSTIINLRSVMISSHCSYNYAVWPVGRMVLIVEKGNIAFEVVRGSSQ